MIAWMLCLVLTQEPAKPAEAAPPKPEKKAVYVALVGGDVVTVTKGVLKGGTVLLKDDKIFKVGAAIDLPEGTTKIDVSGKRVLPGFVAALAHSLGLSTGTGKIADALDPFQESLKLALAGGVTTAFVEPGGGGGGLFGGGTPPQAPGAVIKMSYGTLDGMLLAEPASVSLATWMTGNPAEVYDLRENLQKARTHLEKERDFEKRRAENKLKAGETPPKAAGPLETYVKLLKGEIPARMSASHAEDLRRALDLINEFKFKAVLTDVVEGWTMADEIGRARAYCVMQPRAKAHAPRQSSKPAGSSIEQAAIFRKTGVKFALLPPNENVSTGGILGRDLQTLPLEGAFAIRGGLDEQTALEAITITAAEILGVDTRVGSIEEGKDADLVVLDGDPFDYRTFVDMTFVNGRLLYEKSKSPYFSHLKPRR
ncbi:MAG TPA: amidohydrolase family protein [Planctomycetota bacterium]|jgi:imidazolonepropionase-like amidohydrolase|nr:amidohydrolase family protein [Planctomycetota bacterium]